MLLIFALGSHAQTICHSNFKYYVDTSNKVHFFDKSYNNYGPLTGSVHYTWKFGDTGRSTLKNPAYHYDSISWYYVTLSVADSGCYDSVSIMISNKWKACQINNQAYGADTTTGVYFMDYSLKTGFNTKYLWSFGDGYSDSTQKPTHIYKYPGKYNVCLYGLKRDTLGNTYCSFCDSVRVGKFYGLSACVLSSSLKLKIYPNPVNNTLNIYLPDNITRGTLYVKNVLGQVINTQEMNTPKSTLDMGMLSQGMYLIQLQTTQGMYITRVIKQ